MLRPDTAVPVTPERKPARMPVTVAPRVIPNRAPERKSGSALSRIAFDCDIKMLGDGSDEGTIEGYASVFGLLDRGGDIVEPGAFKASLADWKKRKASPPILWQHDPDCPIGVWTDMAEDDKGLKVTGKLILDVSKAADARALIKGGAVKGLSIGYQTKDYMIDRQTGVRHLKKVDLWEVSLVTFPMLPEAGLTGAKGGFDFDPRVWEKAFRDGGLSNTEAKLAVSIARKMALRDGGRPEQEAVREGMADTLMSLRKASEALRA